MTKSSLNLLWVDDIFDRGKDHKDHYQSDPLFRALKAMRAQGLVNLKALGLTCYSKDSADFEPIELQKFDNSIQDQKSLLKEIEARLSSNGSMQLETDSTDVDILVLDVNFSSDEGDAVFYGEAIVDEITTVLINKFPRLVVVSYSQLETTLSAAQNWNRSRDRSKLRTVRCERLGAGAAATDESCLLALRTLGGVDPVTFSKDSTVLALYLYSHLITLAMIAKCSV